MTTLAIAGATGVMGSEIVQALRDELPREIAVRLLATAGSAGEVYEFNGRELLVEILTVESLSDASIVVFATPPAVAEPYLPKLRERGTKVVELVERKGTTLLAGIAAIDSMSHVSLATPAVQIAYPVIHALASVERCTSVVATTLHGAATAGKNALDELWAQNLAIFNQQSVPTDILQHQLAFNLLPQVDVVQDDARTAEERRFMNQISALLGAPIKTACTALRVPILHGMGLTITVDFTADVERSRVEDGLARAPGVRLERDWTVFPTPLDVGQSTDVHVGRVRVEGSRVECWLCADPLAVTARVAAEYILSHCE